MKKIVIVFVLIASVLKAGAQQNVFFSVQAHQDDWQLYMSKKVLSDLTITATTKRTVFITLTAGDEGNGTSITGTGTIPYYLARENGSVYSSKFLSDFSYQSTPAEQFNVAPLPTITTANINGHTITKYVYRNTVNYYLRLPDGNNTGAGYAGTGNQSLQRLKQHAIKSITSVDGVNKYTSWSDVTNTIKAIVFAEKITGGQVWMYTTSLDTVTYPDEHSDHIYASTAAQEAVSNLAWVGIYEFVGYNSSDYPANLTTSEHLNESAFFGVYNWGMYASKYPGSFDVSHKAWLSMEYFITKRTRVGTAP